MTIGSRNPRAIIVEDEALIAMHLQELLEAMGLTVVAMFRNAEVALAGLSAAAPDVAVLDVNLGSNQTSLPVAQRLAEAGVPFVFVTGYGGAAVKDQYPDVAVLTKPVDEAELRRVVGELLHA